MHLFENLTFEHNPIEKNPTPLMDSRTQDRYKEGILGRQVSVRRDIRVQGRGWGIGNDNIKDI